MREDQCPIQRSLSEVNKRQLNIRENIRNSVALLLRAICFAVAGVTLKE